MIEIQPQHLTFGRLLTGRLFRIPQYQRSYSWQSKQRRDLFDDIARARAAGERGHHFLATVVGLRRETRTIVTDAHHVVEIVDGQQRLTTLVLLLRAISSSVDRSDAIGGRIGVELDELLVKPDKASLLLLQTNHDSSQYFANYLRTGIHPHHSTARVLADRELLMAIEECEAFVDDWIKSGQDLADLVSLLKNRLTCIFHEISDEAVVYTVFEVLNSRGLDVSWFDRLKSMLMAIVFDTGGDNRSEHVDEVHRLWTDIYKCVGLRLGMSTESLVFAATLKQQVSPNRPMGQADAADLLRNQAAGGPEPVIRVTRWLKSVTEAVDRLHANRRLNAVTEIVQARLLAVAIMLRLDLSEDFRQRALRRWENVTFRIYGMYDKDARTKVGDYVRLAWRISNDSLSEEQILTELSTLGKDYPVEGAVLELSAKDCYTNWQQQLRYFFYRYEEHLAIKANQKFNNEQWSRIWEATAATSIEHIYPQHGAPEGDPLHLLGNLVLLPPGLNSKLGAKPPEDKADDYVKTGLFVARQAAVDIGLAQGQNGLVSTRGVALCQWAEMEWAD